MSLNFLLLSIFAKCTNFGSDINAFRERYKVLTVIYANLCFILMVSAYEGVARFLFDILHAYKLILITIPSVIISFIYLKKGKTKIAAIIVLAYMHFINIGCTFLDNGPMVGLYGLMTFPYFAFFLTSSKRIHIINACLCGCEYVYHVCKIQQSFQVTFTEEQSMHIVTLMLSAFFGPGFLMVACFLQKDVESSAWHLAQSNHKKSENLTKEIMRMMNSQEAKAISMSNGVVYPLESMIKSVDYLLKIIGNPDELQILKNIRLNGEMIMRFLTGELDNFISKMKVESVETSVTDIIHKTLAINSEDLRTHQVSAVVSIDDDVPQIIRTDTTKFFRICLNLFNHAVDSAMQGSKILVHLSCQSQKEIEAGPGLNKIFKSSQFDMLSQRRTSSKGELEEFLPSKAPRVNTANLFSTKNMQDIKELSKTDSHISSETEPWTIYITPVASHKSESRPVTKKKYLRIYIQFPQNDALEDQILRVFDETQKKSAPTLGQEVNFGLLICKQFCLKLGGDIKLYSKANNEIVFVLHIPIKEESTNNEKPRTQSYFHKKPRALTAEDYVQHRNLLKLLLEREGVDVIAVSNGQEAVEKYKASEEDYFDFLVIDTHITKIDGFTAVKVIRYWENQQHRRKVDVYFTSDRLTSEEIRGESKAKLGGLDQQGIYCLEKPFNLEAVKTIAEKYKRESTKNNLDISMQESERNNLSNLSLLESDQEMGIRNRRRQGATSFSTFS